MAKKTGLGKGLDALFSDNSYKKMEDPLDEEVVQQIKITEIEPNADQPRKKFDEDKLEELASSIKRYGVIQPIIVMPKDGYYQIVAGERRWRAAKKAGLTEMPCLVRTKTEQENREIALIENIQRENLNPIEKARGLRRLLDDYGLSQQQLADKLGMSRSGLTNNVRILNLDPRVIDLVLEHNFSERQCRELMRVQDPDKQYKLALGVVENGDNYDDLVRKIDNDQKLPKRDKEKAQRYQAIYRDIEDSFQGFFGTKVKLEAGKRKGKIVIEYSSNDDLERILHLIK
ncbi:MAG: ParB/RepB/Spo0J family partition protein [Clostridium sp.]|jgi:parB-like partition proteins|nr:ParB/RepB/Spo0J family partition protein [Clostridium sp.]CCZ18022.1 stage 0 sporulation protein J [Clostridium sp. CAG:780]